MSQTLLQIQEQIARLQRDEQRLKVEAAEVIAKIRVAIEAYGFTPDDLFGGSTGTATRSRSALRASGGTAPRESVVKFTDGHGNVWGGRGPRPNWLRTALAQGHSLEDFAVDRMASAGAAGETSRWSSASSAFGGNSKRRVVAIKFRDGVNVWSGRGSYPRWLREAIDKGRSVEDFRV